jgi:hypothetical protein
MHIPSTSCALAVTLALAVLAIGGSPARALHDPDITQDEFKCQYKTEGLAWKYYAKRIACVVSCQRDQRDGGDLSKCVVPSGTGVNGCINGSHGNAQGHICNACNPDPPECYPPGSCSQLADAELGLVEPKADTLLGEIYCDDSGSGDGLTATEGKYQDGLAKVLLRFAAKKARCIAKCHAIVHKTGDTTIQCTPPGVNEPKTQYCIDKLTDYSGLKLYKLETVADPPECHAGKTSAQWVQEVEDDVDALDPGFNCGE